MKGCNRLLLILFLLFFVLGQSHAQSNNNNRNTTTNDMFGLRTTFNSSTAVLIVVLISAFLFIIFFSMYVRQCGGRAQTFDPSSVAARPRRQQGLAPEVIKTFPTLVYSEVKGIKIGTDALECAVCLSEFDGGETLRLLPVCSHVFHPDCIDAWLASHVTCPLCRRNLAGAPKDGDQAEDEAAVEVEEAVELDRIASRRRPTGFPRSHSTGHSLNHDRFTLRLPEEIRREIVAGSGGGIQRAASVRVGSRRGWSVRLGRSGNWASAFGRNFSARVPAWSAARRWDDEGKIWSVRSKIDGDGAKREDAGDQRV